MKRLFVALFLLFAWQTAGVPDAAGAEAHFAALVIDYGNGNVSYAVVPFEADSISGIELLRESGLSLVSIPFGGLGEGVCSIEDHGCGVGDCRRLCQTNDANSPFWHFYVLGEDGWELQSRGASGTRVEPGDIQGWSWTGDDPQLPAVTFDQVSERANFADSSDRAAFRTFDAAGTVITRQESDAPWLEYLMVAVLITGLALALLYAARRRKTSEVLQ